MDTNLITIGEYARRIGLTANAVRRKCLRGTLPGAVKIGRDWLVPEDAEYPDKRVKTGIYIGSRKDREK